MKRSIQIMAILFLLAQGAAAQNYNLVIFSEDGEGFYAIVNGVRQNAKPETNVKITGLNSQALSLRVEFENKALPALKQNMAPEPGMEHTVRIKKNKKLEMKLQYFGSVPVGEAPKSGASEVAYHTSDNSGNAGGYNTSDGSASVNTGSDGNSSQTTITTTETRTNDNVSVNINLGGVGMNMNVNGTGAGNPQSTTSTTVTTTSSSSGSGNVKSETRTGNVKGASSTETSNTAANYGCSAPMTEANFSKMKKSVEDKPFSETKMSTAKLATKNNCLSVAQVKSICGLFSMDDDKLQYARYAYDYCTEKGNYYQVSEAFSFSGTTEEFNKFLESK